jgi:VanZ family protein
VFIKENQLRTISGPLLVLYWIALFIGTHMPMPQLPQLPENSDKVMHFVAYAGLSFLFLLWKSLKKPLEKPLALSDILAITGIVALYANIDELLQIPVNRFCDPYDVLADWTGMFIGIVLYFIWNKAGKKLIVRPVT